MASPKNRNQVLIFFVLVQLIILGCNSTSVPAAVTASLRPSPSISSSPADSTPVITPSRVETVTLVSITATKSKMSCDQPTELLPCVGQEQTTCYDSYGLGNGNFVITMWVRGLDVQQEPYLNIGTNQLSCQVSEYQRGYIVCRGPRIEPQQWDMQLFYQDNRMVYCGSLNVLYRPTQTPTRVEDDTPTPGY
jgi:hypothetical protein